MQLRLVATLDADCLVLRFLDGAPHSEFPIVDRDPFDTLAREGHPRQPVQRPWSLGQLDAALRRQGYERTTLWRDGPGRRGDPSRLMHHLLASAVVRCTAA